MINDLINALRVQDLNDEGRQHYLRIAASMPPQQAIAHMKQVFSQNTQFFIDLGDLFYIAGV